MYEVLVNRLGGQSLPRKSVVRLTDRPDMTLSVYRGRKTTRHNTSHRRRYNVILASMPTGYTIKHFVPKSRCECVVL